MYCSVFAYVGVRPLRAPRANHVFGTDEKRIRTKNMVMNKNKGGLGWLLFKLVDRVRTASRPRKSATLPFVLQAFKKCSR
jgi:hypothetical protein